MESYPTEFLVHLSPLVIVQGLGKSIEEFASGSAQNDPANSLKSLEDGESLFRQQSQLGDVSSITSFLKILQKFHSDEIIWDSTSLKSEVNSFPHKYHFKFVDSHFLPKLKESNQPSEEKPVPNQILAIDWVQKYRHVIPSIFVSFYELDGTSTEPQDVEKIDSELVSEITVLKNQLAKRNTRHLVILSSSASSIADIEYRVNSIRKQVGMNNRNCLVLLHSSPPKEVGILVQSALQVIRAAEIEFYSSLEKKIRKKRARTIGNATDQFSEDATEARYALKLGFTNEFKQQYDLAVKSYEIAYESLIQLFEGLSPQDENWSTYRLLLDITIFHIVKLNLYQELPNLAYRKFDVHIQSVIYFLKKRKVSPKSYSVCNWLSQQFKWLAQLSDLAPQSLIPTDVPYKPDLKDPLSPLVLPHSGYLYLQSIELLRRRGAVKNDADGEIDPFFAEATNEEFNATLKNLLNFAKLAFQKKDNIFVRSISCINFQIAEELYKAKDYESAVKFYEQSLDSIKEDEWGYLSSTIYFKLFKCSMKLKKHFATVMNLLELSLINDSQLSQPVSSSVKSLIEKGDTFAKFMQEEQEKVLLNVSTDETYDILQGEVVFKSSEFSLTKFAQFQVKLSSNINKLLEEVTYHDVLITFQGSFLPIMIKHNSELPNDSVVHVEKLISSEDESYLLCSANLAFKSHEEKILVFDIPTKKIGTNTCVSISSTLDYRGLFEIKLTVPINVSQFKTRHQWYDKGAGKRIISNINPETCEIVPRVPETVINFDKFEKYAVVGEVFPIKIIIDNKDHERVDAELEAQAAIDNDVNDDTLVETYWNGDKEEKILKLQSLKKDKIIEQVLKLKAPNSAATATEIQLKVKVTLFVNGDYDVPIVSYLNTKISVIDPFKISISFLPRILDEDLPSVFVIRPDEQPLPKPSRYWLADVGVVNNLESEVELLSESITFVSSNKHMVCKELEEKSSINKEENRIEAKHLIETVIEDGHTYRNITFDSMLSLKYKRKSTEDSSEYLNKPWKFTLPLLDPRVLLDITVNEETNDFKLIFMIENPTARIFSFALNLIENQNFQVSGPKVQNISALPCTRQKIEYHAVPLATGWLNLPQLNVYDLNYRVNLPTLLVTDKGRSQNREILVYIPE